MKHIEIFDPIKSRIVEIIGKDTFLKEASFAIQYFEANKYLGTATKESKQKALLNLIQVGLTLNPIAKETYLIPRSISYKDEQGNWKKRVECNLEPSYIGLVKLLTNAGSVTSINTQIVYEGDYFDIDLGNSTVSHKPHFLNNKEKGKIIGVYSIAILSNSNQQIEWMDVDSVNEIKNRSESYKAYLKDNKRSSIWNSDLTEMIRKTIIRRIYKYLPRTERMEKIDQAVNLDNQDYIPSVSKIGYIESLITSSILEEREKTAYFDEILVMNNNRANDVIKYLKENQPETLKEGFERKTS